MLGKGPISGAPIGTEPEDVPGLTITGTKIARYLLDVDHPEGGPKAEFYLAHGVKIDDLEPFLNILFDHARPVHLVSQTPTEFGIKFVYEGPMKLPDGSIWRARSVWFQATDDPRILLVTAYPF